MTDAALEYNFYAYYPVGTATSYATVELPDISKQDGTKTLEQLKAEDDFLRGTATANPAIQVQFTVAGKTSALLNLRNTTEFVGGHIYNDPIEIGADIRTIKIGDLTITDWESSDEPALNTIIPY